MYRRYPKYNISLTHLRILTGYSPQYGPRVLGIVRIQRPPCGGRVKSYPQRLKKLQKTSRTSQLMVLFSMRQFPGTTGIWEPVEMRSTDARRVGGHPLIDALPAPSWCGARVRGTKTCKMSHFTSFFVDRL